MDLGFGAANSQVGSVAANALLQSAKAQEEAVSSEISRYDALLQDDEALEQLRAKRLAQMKQQQNQQLKWRAAGHGAYTELASGRQDARDVAREFFAAAKQSERMVVHFYRPSTPLCDVFHAHLSKLADKHAETRFVKINVENCDNECGSGAAFLVERLGIVIMPTVVIVKNRQAVHHIRGFDELGATENFSTRALEYVLGVHGAIYGNKDEEEVPEELIDPKGVNAIRLNDRRSSARRFEEGDDEEEY